LKVFLVNLLAALNFANVFLNYKRLENKKNVKKRKNRDQNKKINVKNVSYIYDWLYTRFIHNHLMLADLHTL